METQSAERKKRASTYRYHVVRVLLFAMALACAVAGMLMLTMASDRKARSETVSSEVARAEAQANVLLVMGYDESDVLTPLARKGVVDIMNASAVAVDVEYLDAINCPKGSLAYRTWAKAFEQRLRDGGQYHSIICCDDEALTFVEDRYEDLFDGVPVVFFNVNDFDHARTAVKGGYAAGIVEQGYCDRIVELARRLRPGATRILAVVDSTPSGVGDRAQFSKAVSGTGLDVEYADASKLTRDALGQQLASAGGDTIVFFLDAFDDVYGNAYTRDQSARFVAESSRQPVFGIATGGVGEGLVGASFTDPESDGQRAATMCIEILNGTSPSDIDLVTDGSGGYAFDANVMEKHGIEASSLPPDAGIINQSAFTWESISPMLLPLGLLVAGALLIVAFAVMGYRHSMRNAKEIIAQSNDLRRRFYHDQLTDKPNTQWLKAFVADPRNGDRAKSLVAIDFADFGDINDSFGQVAGDAVLIEFAERLDSIPDKAFLARSTGSEFLLGFERIIASDGPELRGILALLDRPVLFEDAEIDVDAHIGVATIGQAVSLADMAVGVDLAVRESKKDGSANSPVFYDERMKRDMEEKIGVTALLKQSIRDESFVVLYQPQVDLHVHEVCGYEALARMAGDTYRPAQFIPVAEMSGLVIEVSRIITKKVVRQLGAWKAGGQRIVPVAINYSAVQLKDSGYVEFLLALLRQNDVPPSYVKIEITESLLLGDEDGADELFARLGAEGIPVALDDFGTGYTSLSRVAAMPAEIVKIDKSLVDEYAVRGKEGFLDDLVRLVHNLRKEVIVEGVETAEQLQICREAGCDIVQGYYFSRPLLPEAASQYDPLRG